MKHQFERDFLNYYHKYLKNVMDEKQPKLEENKLLVLK